MMARLLVAGVLALTLGCKKKEEPAPPKTPNRAPQGDPPKKEDPPSKKEDPPWTVQHRSASWVGFHPDGKRFLSLGDAKFRIWDPEQRKEESILEIRADSVAAVDVHGKRLMTGGGSGRKELWDLGTGKQIKTWSDDMERGVKAIAFSADGKRVLLVRGGELLYQKMEDPEWATVLWSQEAHSSGTLCMAFTPDGKWAVTGGEDKTVRLWDLEAGTEVENLGRHKDSALRRGVWVGGQVYAVAVRPDGKRALSAGNDMTLKLFDLEARRELDTWDPKVEEGLSSVVFCGDGKRALSATWDDTVMLWDVEGGKALATWKGRGRTVAASPDGRWAVATDGESVHHWKLPE